MWRVVSRYDELDERLHPGLARDELSEGATPVPVVHFDDDKYIDDGLIPEAHYDNDDDLIPEAHYDDDLIPKAHYDDDLSPEAHYDHDDGDEDTRRRGVARFLACLGGGGDDDADEGGEVD